MKRVPLRFWRKTGGSRISMLAGTLYVCVCDPNCSWRPGVFCELRLHAPHGEKIDSSMESCSAQFCGIRWYPNHPSPLAFLSQLTTFTQKLNPHRSCHLLVFLSVFFHHGVQCLRSTCTTPRTWFSRRRGTLRLDTRTIKSHSVGKSATAGIWSHLQILQRLS